MRTRYNSVLFRLNEKEHEDLKEHVRLSGMAQESYIRTILNGYIPKSNPPIEYHKLIRELNSIGNNLNQIALKANALNLLDAKAYQKEVEKLQIAILTIIDKVTTPERIQDHGNNKNLGN